MLHMNSYLISWILGLLIFDVKYILGLNTCREELISSATLPTELQSEVLLPCSFTSDLLNSNQTEETSVVWIQLSSTVTNIVEISLDGETKFWTNRLGRIKTVPKLQQSERLDFSIRISNLQQSDLGVYNCQLFRETNCFLAYKSIELHKADSQTWIITAGAAGGAVLLLVVLLVLLIIVYKCLKRPENNCEPVYANTQSHRAQFAKQGGISLSNPVYK